MKKYILIFIVFLISSILSFGQTNVNWDSIITVYRIDSTKAYKKEFSVNPCGLDRKIDEFTGEITCTIVDDGGDISFVKIIKAGISSYYLSIWIKESGIYTGTGVVLILENGQKISKPTAKVDYNYAANSFYTTVFLKLNANDIALLKTSGISKYKLYISEGQTAYASKTKDLFICLTKIK